VAADPDRLRVLQPPALADGIEKLVTLADLSYRLDCDERTIRRLRAAGSLPPPDLKIGRSPRWRPETIRRWIERGGRP
jgi:hypothetical protein